MPRAGEPALSPLKIVAFSSLSDVPHAFSTRHGGVSPAPFQSLNMSLSVGDEEANVQRNRRIFFDRIGVAGEQVVRARLTHSNAVSVFKKDDPTRLTVEDATGEREAYFGSDAVVSDVSGLRFFLTFADCVPLVLYDPGSGAVGAAHAGWRGTAAGIACEVIRTMHESFRTQAQDLVVGIGPSVGPCCYSVQSQVLEQFRRQGQEPIFEERDQTLYLDLWESNRLQLRESGVQDRHIENMNICTSCSAADFYSHRAENGRTGRFALCVGAA